MDQRTLAARQFGAAAEAYLTSPVHAEGEDLRRLAALARAAPAVSALDLGCGAGHAGFALAEGGCRVTAYDLSAEMLATAQAEARRRGLADFSTRQGPAEHLPFADASFDLIVSRFSAHHWSDVRSAMREAARVLKPAGAMIMIDVMAPETPLFDTLLQTVEILRDASHVRDYRLSEWRTMFKAAGFQAVAADTWRRPMAFDSWIARASTPDTRVAAIRDMFARAVGEARAYFEVQPDDSFSIDVAWMQARLAYSTSD